MRIRSSEEGPSTMNPKSHERGRRWPAFIAALQPQVSQSTVRAELPESISSEEPSREAPAHHRDLVGEWQGWGGLGMSVDIRLLVERVDREGATIHYAAADSSGRRTLHRLTCAIEGETLAGATDGGERFALRRRNEDTAEFLWNLPDGGWMCGVVARVDPRCRQSVERIPLSGTDDTLEVRVFAPEGTGPFPTLLFNHGSTGDGTDPSLFPLTWTCLPLARHFTERGWLVAFPQRRGRGGSDGL